VTARSVPSVVRWLDEPRSAAIHFAVDTAGTLCWTPHSQRELGRAARAAGSAISQVGARPGAPVLVALRSSPTFVHAYFGALGIGCVPTAVEPPGPLTSRSGYVTRLRQVLAAVEPCVVVGEPNLADLLEAASAPGSVPAFVSAGDLASGDAEADLPAADRSSIGQLTSGSTGVPKLVRLSVDQVSDHIAAIWRWLDMDIDDVGVSWLPLHHDMGLVGHLLLPLATGIAEHLMQPLTFIRRPSEWLVALAEHSGTITAAPTFGYRYLLDRLGDAPLPDIDLSACRAAVVGAERIEAGVLARFSARLAAHGFTSSSLRPAYGLAEATLAVTGTAPATEPTYVTTLSEPVGTGDLVRTVGRGSLSDLAELNADGDPPSMDRDVGTRTHVSCGRPLPGTTVMIEDDEGTEVPEGTLGEVVVEATWLGAACSTRSRTGGPARRRLPTGDAGFVLGGELYVVGRLGDSLSVRGRRVFSDTIEAEVGVEIARPVVVVMGDDLGCSTVLCLVEGRLPTSTATSIHRIVRRHVTEGRSVVLSCGRGSIPKTTSGKPRRRAIWSDYVRQAYRDQVVSVL